jgi:hypothetical protein
MISKKVTRYYSDCGRGFWKKQQAISHDENCKCWVNPKFKCCLSCAHKCIVKDSNGMENEPHNLETWKINNCKHSENGVPVHKDYDYIRKYCEFYQNKNNFKQP